MKRDNSFLMKVIGSFKEPANALFYLSRNGYLKWMPDETYLKIVYRLKMHKKLDLNNPVTFTEKIQWLKLNDRKQQYCTMVDKYLVKEYVASIIGEQYIIPTLGVWDRPEEIDFSLLPNQFVLKVNHDSGGVVICKDKSTFDLEAAVKKLTSCFHNNGYWYGREWPYKNLKPKVIADRVGPT